LDDGQVSLPCDGLVRTEGGSLLGGFHSVPVLCLEAGPLRAPHRLLLALFGLVLGGLQGRRPTEGLAIRGREGVRTGVKLPAKLYRRAAGAPGAGQQGPARRARAPPLPHPPPHVAPPL